MKDRRLPPFVWQAQAATAALRTRFVGKERTTALAIYQAMTEAASDARAERFTMTTADLADLAGVTPPTLRKYADKIEHLGLLKRERNTAGGDSAMTWALQTGSKPTPERSQPHIPPGRKPTDPPVNAVKQKGKQAKGASPPQPSACAGAREALRSHQVNGKAITAAEADLALAVIRAFNAAAGSSFSLHTAKENRARTCIVMRLREEPGLSAEEHAALIEANFRRPWWDGTPSPVVLYGNRTAYEQALSKWRAGRPRGPASGPQSRHPDATWDHERVLQTGRAEVERAARRTQKPGGQQQ